MKTKKQRLIKYGITVIVFCAIFVVASAVKVKAGTGDNTSGWLWGGSEDANIGGVRGDNNAACLTYPAPAACIDGNETGVYWISMNSSYCDTNDDEKSEGALGCPAAPTQMKDYGVKIPSNNGLVTGYAWSPNLGYIDFAPHSGCPGLGKYAGACDAYPINPACNPGTCPATDAIRNADNTITGWARIVDIAKDSAVGNSGGWAGWIKLSGKDQTGSSYGILVNTDGTITKGQTTSYGWSDELGWIDFSGSKTDPVGTICGTPTSCSLIDTNACQNTSNCGKPNITTKTAICLDNCGSSIAKSACAGAVPVVITCPADVTGTCPACAHLQPGPWREVTP